MVFHRGKSVSQTMESPQRLLWLESMPRQTVVAERSPYADRLPADPNAWIKF
jgi:hypothetical protein